jgi:exosome complex component RRP41
MHTVPFQKAGLSTVCCRLLLQVMAAVFGPKEVEQRSLMDADRAIVRCEYSMATFSTGERRRRGKADRRATEISMAIKNTLEQTIMLELMPRTQIDVYIQVLQADGGTRCASINAAFLALADAGIPMRDIVCACAGGYLDNTVLLDMNYLEDSGGGPDVVVALHPSLDKMVLLQSDNRISLETFEEVTSLVSDGCRAIASFMREVMVSHVSLMAAAQSTAA